MEESEGHNEISITLSQIDEVESRYEEEKKTTFVNTFITEDKSMNSNFDLVKNIQKSKDIYRKLTMGVKGQEDLLGSDIDKSINDLNDLQNKGIFANLGMCSQNGVHYTILFGAAYCRIQVPAQKIAIQEQVTSVLKALAKSNKVGFIYIHSGCSAFQKGGLKMCKNAYLALPAEHKKNVQGIYVL